MYIVTRCSSSSLFYLLRISQYIQVLFFGDSHIKLNVKEKLTALVIVTKPKMCYLHRILNDRIENYSAYIVFISKYHSRAEGCLSIWEIDERCSSPPPPLPSGALSTTPTPYPYTYWGLLWLKPEGVGGGGREQSSSISCFLGNSAALSVLKQIVHILSFLERLFHSVIYNSVVIRLISVPDSA